MIDLEPGVCDEVRTVPTVNFTTLSN